MGTHARDKDAVVAVMALCEVAAYCRHQGITLCDQMENLFKKYGYYKEGLAEGMKEGIAYNNKENAKKMKEEGIDIETIIKITNLTKEEIENL